MGSFTIQRPPAPAPPVTNSPPVTNFFSQFPTHGGYTDINGQSIPAPGTQPGQSPWPTDPYASQRDFNLGGFQPQTGVPPGMRRGDWGLEPIPDPSKPFDPGITLPGGPQAQPTYGVKLGAPNDPRVTTQPQPYQQGPTSGGSPGGPIDFNDQSPLVNIGGPGSGHQYATVGERNRALYGPGSPLGGANGMTDFGPSSWSFAPSGGGPGTLTGPYGTLANGIGNQAGVMQPMNPSQQSGMVLMQSPDGLHMQNVPQEHVAHYTGLGATQVNGQQMTGSSYGGGNGQ